MHHIKLVAIGTVIMLSFFIVPTVLGAPVYYIWGGFTSVGELMSCWLFGVIITMFISTTYMVGAAFTEGRR
jgi:hypothetical protein